MRRSRANLANASCSRFLPYVGYNLRVANARHSFQEVVQACTLSPQF